MNKTMLDYSDALADVTCWLKGFRAADADAELPPNWRLLMELQADIKSGEVAQRNKEV